MRLLASQVAYGVMRVVGAVVLVVVGVQSLWQARRGRAEAPSEQPDAGGTRAVGGGAGGGAGDEVVGHLPPPGDDGRRMLCAAAGFPRL
ncbi:hypothetical protein AB0K60_28625 [Thermopolyspora sp. NPDC052614]|uniref:hypothetical protein n=1 Tax=Thermopolyspora sp. NPDC052614 TaxID=3155682 RepID=UPI00342B389D